MSFNPDRIKPTHDVKFSRKTKNIIYSNLYTNNVPIFKLTSQKHLRLNLDAKLSFNNHIDEKIGKAIEGVGLLHKLQCFLPRSNLLFMNPLEDHIWTMEMSYMIKLQLQLSPVESIQYNTALAITGAIRESSREKLYTRSQELGLE